jgi:hypothetical protein
MNTTDSQLLLEQPRSFLLAKYALGLVAAWLVFKVLQALYNVSPLHPLSRIPGPKLAAATYLPEFYYDVVKFGCYTKEISKMHERYGKHTNTFQPHGRTLANFEPIK